MLAATPLSLATGWFRQASDVVDCRYLHWEFLPHFLAKRGGSREVTACNGGVGLTSFP